VATIKNLLSTWTDESGQDLAEYAILIGLVALAVTLSVILLGDAISSVFNSIDSTLEGASSQASR
jgi:Flp pilus assembly pilin Flp